MSEPRNGAHTSNEEMLGMLQGALVQLGVMNTKLDMWKEAADKNEQEVSDLTKQIDSLKLKVYSMSGVFGIGTAVLTNIVIGSFTK